MGRSVKVVMRLSSLSLPLLLSILTRWVVSKPARSRSGIVGGDEVVAHSIPWQVSLQLTDYDDWHYCGGALLTDSVVVTVAHCCYQLDMSVVKAVAGEHDLYADEGTEQSAGVASYQYHELYDPYTMENDICLIQLDTPLRLNSAVNVVKRAGPTDSFSGVGRVSGWGDLYEGGVMPDVLMGVEVPLLTDGECRLDYGDQSIKDSMLCAGDTGKDACQGDSGGPLTCSASLDILCGLVSWGLGCGREGYPGVYTEVAFFSDWIDQTAVKIQS